MATQRLHWHPHGTPGYDWDWFRRHMLGWHGVEGFEVDGLTAAQVWHDQVHASEEWLNFTKQPVIYVEASVDGETIHGYDEHQLADDIQRAVGRVDVDHFHLRSDCLECMEFATYPNTPESNAKIRAHILSPAHDAEVTVTV
jgi:hypothetical protein